MAKKKFLVDKIMIDSGSPILNDEKLTCESPFVSALREFTEETNGCTVTEKDLLLHGTRQGS